MIHTKKPKKTDRCFKLSALFTITVMLSACASNDDFGRTRSNFFTDKVLPLTRTAVHEARGLATSDYEYTSFEVQMRTYAESLRKSGRTSDISGIKGTFLHYAEEAGFVETDHELDRTDAHNAGVTAFESRGKARRPGALLSAIDNDYRLSVAFARSSEKTYQDDWKRLQFLASSPDVNSRTNINVIGRARENRRIVLRTHQMMVNRIDEYRLEARDSLLRYPDGNKVRLYSEINRLAALIDELRLAIRPLATPGRPPGSYNTPVEGHSSPKAPKPIKLDSYKTAKASG